MNNSDIHFSWIFIEMIINRQCALCVAYHSLLEAPLDLETLGLSLYSLSEFFTGHGISGKCFH